MQLYARIRAVFSTPLRSCFCRGKLYSMSCPNCYSTPSQCKVSLPAPNCFVVHGCGLGLWRHLGICFHFRSHRVLWYHRCFHPWQFLREVQTMAAIACTMCSSTLSVPSSRVQLRSVSTFATIYICIPMFLVLKRASSKFVCRNCPSMSYDVDNIQLFFVHLIPAHPRQ